MNLKRKKCLLLLLPLLCVLTASAFAQSQLISGTVTDEKGAVIQSAKVTITDEAKKSVIREVTTNDNGRFEALNIQPGLYSIAVEAPGFKKLEISNVKLDVNTKLDIGEVK